MSSILGDSADFLLGSEIQKLGVVSLQSLGLRELELGGGRAAGRARAGLRWRGAGGPGWPGGGSLPHHGMALAPQVGGQLEVVLHALACGKGQVEKAPRESPLSAVTMGSSR